MRGLRWLGVVAFVFVVASSAAAQQGAPSASGDQVARNLFNAGKVAYDAGDYQDALQFFEQAYERSHRSALLYNIGQAADRMRLDDKAIASFRAYLDQTPDAPNRAEVENRIRALEQSRKAAALAAANAPAAPAAVPTAAETARASEVEAPVVNEAPVTTATPEDSGGGGVTSKWWFWTAIGAVVVGGTVAAIALSSGGDPGNAPLMMGDVGGTIMTLEASP